MSDTYPLFGGTWSDDPVLRAEQEELVRLWHERRRFVCTRCGCVKLCREKARRAWLWRKTQDIERRRVPVADDEAER